MLMSSIQGMHHCLGAQLARLEARAALLALLSRARRRARLADPEVGYQPSLVHRGPTSVRISITGF
jgi:cytochrome P450